ncbi:MAG TPA: hypothetical protein VLE89_05140 [Chlamydiales bacterium]|nr:hypothetical protein [Chlamydiales bacterium]
MINDSLTTETLRKKFKNNFDLCNFSINIARNIILGGTQATLGEILEIIEERADEYNQDK